jgi:hypothetical protein
MVPNTPTWQPRRLGATVRGTGGKPFTKKSRGTLGASSAVGGTVGLGSSARSTKTPKQFLQELNPGPSFPRPATANGGTLPCFKVLQDVMCYRVTVTSDHVSSKDRIWPALGRKCGWADQFNHKTDKFSHVFSVALLQCFSKT